MDPISLVVAALVAGLTAGITDLGKKSVLDIYEMLRERIHKNVDTKEDARNALLAVEKKPTSEPWQQALKEELTLLRVDRDQELLVIAKTFLERLDEGGAKLGKYNIAIQIAQGIVIGDNSNVTQKFGRKEDDNK